MDYPANLFDCRFEALRNCQKRFMFELICANDVLQLHILTNYPSFRKWFSYKNIGYLNVYKCIKVV